MLCVNKWDLNPDTSTDIEQYDTQVGVRILGRIRYDKQVTLAQINSVPVVETKAPCTEDIKKIWKELQF